MRRKHQHLFVIAVLCISVFGCKTQADSNVAIPEIQTAIKHEQQDQHPTDLSFNYNLDKPDRSWKLPAPLVEVSGNTWVDNNHVIVIEDLHPNLYLINLEKNDAFIEKTIPFGETEKAKLDIEDVTLANGVIYALWSHGILFKINNWNGNVQVEKIETGLSKKNNVEGLCYDPVSKNLLLACKDDAGVKDGKRSTRAVYSFDISTKKLLKNPFLIMNKEDFKDTDAVKLSFNPSAIAVHPVTHNIYILTTRDYKGLAKFTHDGKLISYQEIDKDLMPQPEGICFSPTGKMYISSEGKQGDAGNLFEFSNQ